MSNQPKVSVVIPTFNRSTLLTDAIDSVLTQTYSNYEIIVVDDGSTDDTADVVARYDNKVRYIYRENGGLSAARNTGIASAKGEYIAFLDSDDMFVATKLEKQVRILDENPEICFCYSNVAFCDAKMNFLRVRGADHQFKSGYMAKEALLWKACCGQPQSWLIRKKCFDETGGFEESLRHSEEREMSVRLAMLYKMHGLKEPLTKVRMHDPNSLGRVNAFTREEYYFRFVNILFEKFGDRPLVKQNRRRVLSEYYYRSGRNFIRDRMPGEAKSRLFKSIMLRPLRLSAYPLLVSTLFGQSAFNLVVRCRKAIVGKSYFERQQNRTAGNSQQWNCSNMIEQTSRVLKGLIPEAGVRMLRKNRASARRQKQSLATVPAKYRVTCEEDPGDRTGLGQSPDD